MDLLQKPFVDTFFEIFSTPESIILGLVVTFYLTIGVFITRVVMSMEIDGKLKDNGRLSEKDEDDYLLATPVVFLFSPILFLIFVYALVSWLLIGKKNRSKYANRKPY